MRNMIWFAVLFMLFSVACEKVPFTPIEEEEDVATGGVEQTESTNPLSVKESVSAGTILIHASEKDVSITVTIAATDEEREDGLSGKESLPENFGMWFIFPSMMDPNEAPFWTKDNGFSIDMIFVDNEMKIVDIIENTEPNSSDYLYSKASYQYVLEVIAGTARDHGIAVGDAVEQRIGAN